MEMCSIELQATGGANDGATWSCDQQRDHIGPHQTTFGMHGACCDVVVVCQVRWDQHPDGHQLVTI